MSLGVGVCQCWKCDIFCIYYIDGVFSCGYYSYYLESFLKIWFVME